MDNLGNNSSRTDNSDKPVPFDNGPGNPVPVKEGPAGSTAPVSRAPLNLGGTGAPAASPAPASPAPVIAGPASPTLANPAPPATTPKPAPHILAPQVPVRKPVTAGPVPAGRISNCKTFFTKLHPGAIKFMDDQITAWLKENPGIVIKHTNAVTGDIVEKKTEPSILITVWW